MKNRDHSFKQESHTSRMSLTRNHFQPRPFATHTSEAQIQPFTDKKPSVSIQPKLTIGEPNDAYEREADRVAIEVVQKINSPAQSQRQENDSQEVSRAIDSGNAIRSSPIVLHRKSSVPVGPASEDFEDKLSHARNGGVPLEPSTRGKMESAMGADFSRVKIHTDTSSDRLSQSIQAKAFTTGQDIFFKQGEYNPTSYNGQQLLAHELTHVIQQNTNTIRRVKDRSGNRVKKYHRGLEAGKEKREISNKVSDMMKQLDKVSPTHKRIIRFILERIEKNLGKNSCIEFWKGAHIVFNDKGGMYDQLIEKGDSIAAKKGNAIKTKTEFVGKTATNYERLVWVCRSAERATSRQDDDTQTWLATQRNITLS